MDYLNSVWPQEGDAIDADLDKQEMLEPKEGELCGDELLNLHYSLVSVKLAPALNQRKPREFYLLAIGVKWRVKRPRTKTFNQQPWI